MLSTHWRLIAQEKIHPDGPTFSRIIAGVWRWHTVSSSAVEQLINTAIDNSITTFDHADIYGDHGNEEIFGKFLKKDPALRSKMQLITKCGIKFPSSRRPETWVKHYDTSKDHIIWSVENSLKMLGTDHLDLLLIHRPDPLFNPIEAAEAFDELKKAGKVLHIGVSNFSPSQFRMLQHYLPYPIVTNQIEISLSKIDSLFNGDLDTLMEFNASPMAWSPLGGGKTLDISEREVFNKAAKYNASYSQLSLSWLMKHPSNIFPIIGTTQSDRIKEAAQSVDITLDRQDWFEMLKWVMKKEVP